MKKTFFFLLFTILLFDQTAMSQVVTPCANPSNPSNRLWVDYAPNPSNPSALPASIPSSTVSYSGLVKKEINATYAELAAAIQDLTQHNGGVITFKNLGAGKTINFNAPIDITRAHNQSCITILIDGADKVTFNGNSSSSCFIVRRQMKVILQNATFRNCKFTKAVAQTPNNYRTAGGAIEVAVGGWLRAYNCKFLNNSVDEWNNTLANGYNGVHENHNGGAIRFNMHATGQLFKCTFENNRAVTGGAVGATSINKLTIMDCLFKNNVATAYWTAGNDRRRRIVEGAGALRVDRTAQPLEVYRTEFNGNAGNLKTSCIQVYIRPLRDHQNGGTETGPYPGLPQNALIIEDCLFKNNKFYNYQGAINPDRTRAFFGCMMFLGSDAQMSIKNTVFDGNDVGITTIYTFLKFNYSGCTFANTNFIQIPHSNGGVHTGAGTIAIRAESPQGLIEDCTFYNNNPNSQADHRVNATDLFIWQPHQQVTVNNCIFYRTNTDINWQQSRTAFRGTGNNQFIPNVNMAQLNSVSTNSVNTTDPNITPNSIVDMCLGTNSLPQGIGGLSDCSAGGGNNNPPPVPTPHIADGIYTITTKGTNQNLYTLPNGGLSVDQPAQNDLSQQWDIKRIPGTATYTVQSVSNQRYLEVPYGRCNATGGDPAGTWTQANGAHQQWLLDDLGNGEVLFRPVHCQQQALTSWVGNPTNLLIATLHPNANYHYLGQRFVLQAVVSTPPSGITDGIYTIRAKGANQNISTQAGGSLTVAPPNSNQQAQQWSITRLTGTSSYTIQSVANSRYLEVPYAHCSATASDAAGTWTQAIANHQKWVIDDLGNGDVLLRPLHCDHKALTSWVANPTNLVVAFQHSTPGHHHLGQLFQLQRVGTSARTAAAPTTGSVAESEVLDAEKLTALVAPNPVTNQQISLTLNLPQAKMSTTILLYDVLGNQVYYQTYEKLPQGKQLLTIDLQDRITSKGVYFLKIYQGKQSLVQQVSILP